MDNRFETNEFQMKIKYLDLVQTADSGQCFRWKKANEDKNGCTYEIPAFGRVLKVRQQGENFTFYCSEQEFREIWWNYLDLSGDYEQYLNSVDETDEFLKAASRYGSGIRILRQDPWETAVSFLISQCNNIPRIKGCIEKICRYFGEDGICFPTPERLAALEGEELSLFRKGCSLGYRDEYILSLAGRIAKGSFSLEECGELPYEECVRKLRTLQGVGPKVADCIALFGFHKIDAFPIDVHMKQVMYDHYYSEDLDKLSRTKQLKTMEDRYFSRYSGYRGIIQQWIFAYVIGNET